jgi:hypothetical protein
MWSAQGDPVHLEVSSANEGGTAITALIYPAGSATALTLGANDYLTITDVVYISTAGGAYSFCFGAADAAGIRIVKGNAEALGGVAHSFETPRSGPKGVTPRLIAAAGQVDLVATGYITRV